MRRSPKHQGFNTTEMVVDLDGEIPPCMAESGSAARPTSSPQPDVGEVSSKAPPSSPNKASGMVTEMAKAHASVSRALEEPSLPPRPEEIRGADPSPAADNEQRETAAPVSIEGAGSQVPHTPASEEAMEGQAPKMEEALAESSLSEGQRVLAGAFLEGLRSLEIRGEAAFFEMLSGMKVISICPKYYSVV